MQVALQRPLCESILINNTQCCAVKEQDTVWHFLLLTSFSEDLELHVKLCVVLGNRQKRRSCMMLTCGIVKYRSVLASVHAHDLLDQMEAAAHADKAVPLLQPLDDQLLHHHHHADHQLLHLTSLPWELSQHLLYRWEESGQKLLQQLLWAS